MSDLPDEFLTAEEVRALVRAEMARLDAEGYTPPMDDFERYVAPALRKILSDIESDILKTL